MALKPCQGCGKQVDTTAKACPGCGRPKPTMAPPPAWAYVVSFGLLGAMAWCVLSPSREPSARSGVVQQAAPVKFDLLDVLPSQPGDLKITNAWRVSSDGTGLVLGKYAWPGDATALSLDCSFPPHEADCDRSLPLRLKLGDDVPACGSSKDSAEAGTGPLIAWRGCVIRIDKAGSKTPRRFERLKAAAIEAAEWTEKVFTWRVDTADLAAIAANRRAGLLEATRRGNVGPDFDISHQLDR